MRLYGPPQPVMAGGTIRTRWFLLLLAVEVAQELVQEVAVERDVVVGPPEELAHLLRVRAPRVPEEQPPRAGRLRAEPGVAVAVLQQHPRLPKIFCARSRI